MDTDLPPLPPPPPPPPDRRPPVVTPPLSRPPRPRNPWKVATLVLVVLLLVGAVGYVSDMLLRLMDGGPVHSAGPRLEEVFLEYNRSSHKVAVISIEGIIMSMDQGVHNLVTLVEEQLKSAKEDEDVKAVILKVDSPGGEVLASDDIARAITKFQKESRKPVVASMSSVAASGGYYVSVPCQWIVANELTITGSIGVIMQSFNYRGLMDKVGVLPETFKSGKFKDMLSGSKKPGDITPEEREMVQALVNETFERFKTVVAEGRKQANEKNKAAGEPGRTLSAKWADHADGRVLSGRQAFELGFVDELGSLETAVARARKLAGIKDANLVEFRPVLDLSSLFRLFARTDVGRVKVDVGLDTPRLRAGYLYFLAPTYVH